MFVKNAPVGHANDRQRPANCNVAVNTMAVKLICKKDASKFLLDCEALLRAGRCGDRRFAWPWWRLLFHCSCVVLAMCSVQNHDAWIQELMFQLRIVQAEPLK